MGKPLLSVLLPTFKRPEMLRQTFDSLLAQTYKGDEFELVVSDDCSGDATQALISEYQPKFRNFRKYAHVTNLGGARNWEFLLQQAEGEFVYLLSDDDAVAPEFLAEYLSQIRDNPELDLLFCGLELRDAKMGFIADHPASYIPGETDGVTRFKDQLLAHHMVISAAYRRLTFLEAGGWDASVGTHLDCTAFCRMALRSRKAVYLPKPLLYYRITPGSWASFSVDKQKKHAVWYRRKLDLLTEDARALDPTLLPRIREMSLWHGKCVLHSFEVELAHGRVAGSEIRKAMAMLLKTFPEARFTLPSAKLLVSTFVGTGWIRMVRKVLSKPDPYASQLALFGQYSHTQEQH